MGRLAISALGVFLLCRHVFWNICRRLVLRASVIGEDELSPTDKKYLEFGKAFETEFVGQGLGVNRNIIETLNLGWKLLHILPKEELDRIDTKILDKYYDAFGEN